VEKVVTLGYNTTPKGILEKRAAVLAHHAVGKVIRRTQPLEGRKLC